MKAIKIKKEGSIWSSLLPLTIAVCLLFSLISISLFQIFLFLAFIFWTITLARRERELSFPSFFWPLLIYAALSLVSSFFSVNPEMSLKDSRELLLYAIIPIVYTGFAKEIDITRANLALLASASASAVYSIFYYFFKSSPGERTSGFMGHYMTQAGLLVLFGAVALSMLFFSREKIRFLWALSFVLALAALILTLTRSAWIGLIVALCLILLFWKPLTLVIVPLGLGLLFLLSPQHIKQRAVSIFSLKGYSNQQRIEYFRAGINIICDFPLLGTGPDTVDIVFQNPKYGLSAEAKRNVHLHNNFIQIAAERGIATFLVWLIFIGWTFISLCGLLRNKDPSLRTLTVAALASLAALVVEGLFEYNFADSEITTLFLYLVTVPFSLFGIQKRGSRN